MILFKLTKGGMRMDEYEYYTLGQVSKLFQISEGTIRRRIKEGKIPKARFCGRILIPAWFVKQGSIEPTETIIPKDDQNKK